MPELLIRQAREDDLPALVAIFNHYVAHGHVTFRTQPHTLGERRGWFGSYGTGRHQLLVGEVGGAVVGCTYSSPYRPTGPFDGTVELSIYLDPGHGGRGTGTALYGALLARLAGQPVHMAVAGVALPNAASVALHRRLGFREVGTFEEYARKDGAWISSTWFQRRIRPIP